MAVAALDEIGRAARAGPLGPRVVRARTAAPQDDERGEAADAGRGAGGGGDGTTPAPLSPKPHDVKRARAPIAATTPSVSGMGRQQPVTLTREPPRVRRV